MSKDDDPSGTRCAAPEDASALPAILDRLARLCGPQRTHLVEDLRGRLAAKRIRVLLVGEAKRGKSTLGNALLGRAVLPTGITPVTAITTQVVPVDDAFGECVEVTVRDGTTTRVDLSDLSGFVSEQGNPRNVLGVVDVVVRLASSLGQIGVTLVDTPGVGSALAHNTEEAMVAYRRMDAAILVLTADPPASASELELLARIRESSVRTFVVLNKVDRLDAAERTEAVDYVGSLLGDERVYACSARLALDGARQGSEEDPGFSRFSADLRTYLATRGGTDLEASLRAAAARIATDARDDTLVELAVVSAETLADHHAVGEFLTRTGQLVLLADEAGGRVDHLHARLRRDLDSSWRAEVAGLRPVARAAVAQALASHQGAHLDELHRVAREAMGTAIGPAVHRWQAPQDLAIRQGVVGSVARETESLDQACSAIRDAAARFLRIDLSVREITLGVQPTAPIVLDFSADLGWRPPLAGPAARLLTRGRAQRTAARTLASEADRLLDRHLGRARSDLQAGLDEGARSYRRLLTRAYADAGTRFEGVVQDALGTADRSAASLAARRAALGAQLRALDAVLASLTGPFGDGTPWDARAASG